jgi:hypothetical protein
MVFGQVRTPENRQERRSRPHRHLGYSLMLIALSFMTTTLHYGSLGFRVSCRNEICGQ